MKTQEEMWENNRFHELSQKYQQAALIAEERINNLEEKLDKLTGQVKHYETIVEFYYKQMKASIRESEESRNRLIEAGEGTEKETLSMIKEIGILVNKWRGDDY